MIGLGVMGRNFALNMADHGFSVAGYDRDPTKVAALHREAGEAPVRGVAELKEFTALLHKPRAIMLLVTAGPPVDAVIQELLPLLEPGDLIIDAGNSHFTDTDVRSRLLAVKGIQFLGVGVSGGEEGARHGPSIMPGGPREAYERVRPILEAAAAHVNGEPCVTYLGPGSAGHFVKMVHNGIEYGLMQLLAESYDLLKRGMGCSDDDMGKFYQKWNQGELAGYLVEITGRIFSERDEKTGRRLIDEILDVAKQTGTGMWTSESAMVLQVPTPTIDVAVAMRNLSILEDERREAGTAYPRTTGQFQGNRDDFVRQLGRALWAAAIITYAQGLALLKAASVKYAYGLDLHAVARIWRGGCIIRAAALEQIGLAYHNRPALPNLLLDPGLGKMVMEHREDLSLVIAAAAQWRVPAPGLMASLGYLDSYCSTWLPANLIQAQRDFFGAHTYERIDAKGSFHEEWGKARTP
jgi:6-phosphogluconate dehydrogenase